MTTETSLYNNYIEATRSLANEIWNKYPNVVEQCVDFIPKFFNTSLKNAWEAHTNLPTSEFWYDSRFLILAMNKGAWINDLNYSISPDPLEKMRLEAGEAPRIARWMTSDLARKYRSRLDEVLGMHLQLIKKYGTENLLDDSAEAYDDFDNFYLPIELDAIHPGRGWIDAGPPMPPQFSKSDSGWLVNFVASEIVGPTSFRKTIRHYVDAVDQIAGGTKNLSLAKESVQDAKNLIISEHLLPFRESIFKLHGIEKTTEEERIESFLWAENLIAPYQLPSKSSLWQRLDLNQKNSELVELRKNLMIWCRNQISGAWLNTSDASVFEEFSLKFWESEVLSNSDNLKESLLRKLDIEDDYEDFKKKINLPLEKVVPDKPSQLQNVLNEIESLEGMLPFKQYVKKLVALSAVDERKRKAGLPVIPISRHLVLLGNPGTGKTTAARLLGRLYKELGILSKGHFTEVGQHNLVAAYVGQTAKKTSDAIQKAKGGVLFLDEAYALAGGERGGYGAEAIEVLVQEMENLRDDFVFIAAGYQADMEKFLSANEGLRSRFSTKINLPDMSSEQLFNITSNLLNTQSLILEENAKTKLLQKFTQYPRKKGFANARLARQIFEDIKMNQAVRLSEDKDADLQIIKVDDITISNLLTNPDQKEAQKLRLDQALQKLNSLIGLHGVKKEISSLVSLARIARIREEKGQQSKPVIGHFVFKGNPGTGKTTVARLVGEIFAALGLLPSGHTVEANRSDLVGEYLGQTAPKVKAKVDSALGGVLFIDEAYSLAPGIKGDKYSEEAVTTLVESLENNRGDFVAILAGYSNEIEKMLSTNQGLKGRITYHLDFDDYSLKELMQILNNLASANDFELSDEYLKKASLKLEEFMKNEDFSNARSVRELFELSIRNQALRLNLEQSNTIQIDSLRKLEASDLPEIVEVITGEKPKFGFV